MSRSTKAPYAKDRNPFMKGKANRKVRQNSKKAVKNERDKISSGKAYRKYVDSWSISDYSFYDDKPKTKRK